MAFNSIAIIGHSGMVGKIVTAALAKTGAPLRVLHRAGSSIDGLDSKIATYQVDYTDKTSVTNALQGVDILVSTVGQPGVLSQIDLVEPAKAAGIKLFVPSEFSHVTDTEVSALVSMFQTRIDVENAFRAADIPILKIATGAFGDVIKKMTSLMGIDKASSTVTVFGEVSHPVTISTLAYIAEGYAQLLASTPPSSLAGRSIGLVEISIQNIPDAVNYLKAQNPDAEVKVLHKSTEELKTALHHVIATTAEDDIARIVTALQYKIAKGTANAGTDIYDVKGYKKITLEELLG